MVKYILASNSPRRKELLAGLGLDFEVRVIDGIDESYPSSLPACEVAQYIAEKKADAYRATLQADELIITADTVVIVGDDILGKPKDEADAVRMLREISGRTHQVTTGVCLLTAGKQRSFSVTNDVTFTQLTDDEIHHYIKTYHPLFVPLANICNNSESCKFFAKKNSQIPPFCHLEHHPPTLSSRVPPSLVIPSGVEESLRL